MMTERKFTTGPWVANFDHDVELPATEVCTVSIGVCEDVSIMAPYHVGDSMNFDPSFYDAHLIAAAPDLYEALETMCDLSETGDVDWDDINEARAALAKARGEA